MLFKSVENAHFNDGAIDGVAERCNFRIRCSGDDCFNKEKNMVILK